MVLKAVDIYQCYRTLRLPCAAPWTRNRNRLKTGRLLSVYDDAIRRRTKKMRLLEAPVAGFTCTCTCMYTYVTYSTQVQRTSYSCRQNKNLHLSILRPDLIRCNFSATVFPSTLPRGSVLLETARMDDVPRRRKPRIPYRAKNAQNLDQLFLYRELCNKNFHSFELYQSICFSTKVLIMATISCFRFGGTDAEEKWPK